MYTYIFLKCTQFLKINAGNALSDGNVVAMRDSIWMAKL